MRVLTFKTYTFGCRVNQAETQEIEKKLINHGFKPINSNQKPDFALINTCVVTKKAEKEVKQLIRKIRQENPLTYLVLCGCAVSYWSKSRFIPKEADLLIANEKKPKLISLIRQFFLRFDLLRGRTSLKISLKNYPDKLQKSGRCLIKIQDGCNQFCSFCIVPYLRKKIKSKKINQIIKEIKEAEKEGMKEIIFTGINLGLFDQDFNENINQLLKISLEKTTIPRISFGSIYPEVIDDEFIKIYKKDWQNGKGRLSRFFHLPLQSGSNKILTMMARKYSLVKFESIVQKLHQALPEALIATDIIVGFPGEGDNEFQETFKFLQSLPMSKYHLFRFSPRPGTVACKMEKNWGRVEEKIKRKRLKILKDLEKKKYQKFLESLKGKILPVLFIKDNKNYQIGLADNQVQIKVSRKKKLKGVLKKMKILKVDYPFLRG